MISKTPWMDIAIEEIGVKEKPGDADNPRVIEYHKACTLHAKKDSVPWCAAFVSFCLERAHVPSTRNARALSYKNFGRKLDKPEYGCIVVFAHKDNPGKGHVTFFESYIVGGKLCCLGGNQSDQVKYSLFSDEEVVGYRMPIGF